MLTDRRKFPRFKRELSIVIHRPFHEERIKAVNMSLDGMVIYNVHKFCEVEEILYLELIFPKGTSIFCNARIVNVYPNTKNADVYKISLQLLDMNKQDKEILKKFLAYSDMDQRDISDYYT